jgi:hypothetical protein
MGKDTTPQGVLFKGMAKKPVVVQFDQDHASSDGGAVLLQACDRRLGLSEAIASGIDDARQCGKVRHTLLEMLQQRLFGIACGYADGNDAGQLADDPIFKLLLGRDPLTGSALASQPTLSRFENAVGPRQLMKMAEALADCVIERHRRRKKSVKRITLDFDPTDDPTHGAQQLTFFNWVYDSWCYLPLAGFVTFDDEPQQYLICYALRAGNSPAKQGLLGILKRLLPKLRQAFPKAKIRIRLDAGFTGPELYEFFEANRMEYVVCMAKNPVLKRLADPLMEPVREAFEAGEASSPIYSEARYKARSWNRARRVIIRADVVEHPGRAPKDNPRFLITNIRGCPQQLYERVYCARGDVENRIKELKYGLEIDRTSCTSFFANQFRVLITAAAYVLMQELRLNARHTRCAHAQVTTLQLRLLKIGAWVERSVRRVVLHLPSSTVYADDWRRIARSIGAVAT